MHDIGKISFLNLECPVGSDGGSTHRVRQQVANRLALRKSADGECALEAFAEEVEEAGERRFSLNSRAVACTVPGCVGDLSRDDLATVELLMGRQFF